VYIVSIGNVFVDDRCVCVYVVRCRDILIGDGCNDFIRVYVVSQRDILIDNGCVRVYVVCRGNIFGCDGCD
jgi:hypothetical protein